MKSQRVRVRRRLIWLSAMVPVVSFGAFVSFAVLDSSLSEARRGAKPVSYGSSRAPESDAAPSSVGESRVETPVVTTTAEVDPLVVEARLVLRGSEAGGRDRVAALRLLVARAPRDAAVAALELLARTETPEPLVQEALRSLATTAAEAFAQRSDLPRFVVDFLMRARSAETALACGAALDALPAGSLTATELARAAPTAPLPEARIVLLRALAAIHSNEVDAAPFAEAMRQDPDASVRAEAFALLASRRSEPELDSVKNVVVRDSALRGVAARVLATLPGESIDQLLVDAFLAETDAGVQKSLAATLSRRSFVWSAVAMSESQVRAVRAATQTQGRQP